MTTGGQTVEELQRTVGGVDTARGRRGEPEGRAGGGWQNRKGGAGRTNGVLAARRQTRLGGGRGAEEQRRGKSEDEKVKCTREGRQAEAPYLCWQRAAKSGRTRRAEKRRGRHARSGGALNPTDATASSALHPGQRRTLRRGGPPPEARLHAQQLPARLGRPPRRGDGLLPCLHHGREHQRRALHAVRRPRQGQHGMLMRRPGTSSPKAPAPSAP